METISYNRTKRVSKSMMYAFICFFLKLIYKFILRTVFIKVFLISYLGIDGLLTNILSLLSLAELGFSSVITCFLYKPIADGNIEKVNSYIHVYKKIYQRVGIVILIVGISICPFIKYFIKDIELLDINIYIAYALYLINSVASYFFSYRNILFLVHQERDVEYKILSITNTATLIFQVLIILLVKNYYIYLIITIILSILSNAALFLYSLKKYPNINSKNVKPLTSSEKKELSVNVKGILCHKVSSVVLSSTDSIIISAFVGSIMLGLYSNYTIITTGLISVFVLINDSLRGSVGNCIVSKNIDENLEIFESFRLMYYWISGFCSICLFSLMNPFIELWLGSEFLINDIFTLFVICFNFFLLTSRMITGLYRESIGNFQKDMWKGIIEAVLNIVISLIFVKFLGLTGVLLGTIISCLLTSLWVDSYVLFKNLFKKSLLRHFLMISIYTFIFLAIGFITWYITSLITVTGILGFIIKLLVCIVLPNLICLILFYRTKEFKRILNILKNILKKNNKIS